jgi:cellulose synthase/poly-beta-1,6-N-acetylglucosamine synthase-like glycosyltransferase
LDGSTPKEDISSSFAGVSAKDIGGEEDPYKLPTKGLLQVAFFLQEENAGKLHSHRWVFNAFFCSQLQPVYVYLVDVGTIPHVDSFSKMSECI